MARLLRRWAPIGLYLFGSAFLLAKSATGSAYTPLACLALLPLFLVIRSFNRARVAFLAGFWGVAYCLMLRVCSSSALELTYSTALMLTLLPALFAFASRQAIGRFGCSVLLLPFGWALLNIGSHAIGLEAGLLSGSTRPGSDLAEIAGFGGWAVLALAVAAVSALLASVVCGTQFCLVSEPRLYYWEPLTLTYSRYTANLTRRTVALCICARGPPITTAQAVNR